MIVTPFRLCGEQDNKRMSTLIDPDGGGEWAVRYLWVTHRVDNSSFYNNYFDPDLTQSGMNIRKQTANLKSDWSAHNKIFEDSAANGNLVWRVKVGNSTNTSIDYIEVWRSVEILNTYFGDTTIPGWTTDSRHSFREQLYESGFDIRELTTYPTISKMKAMIYYKTFVEQWRQRQRCIINTSWNRDINPI